MLVKHHRSTVYCLGIFVFGVLQANGFHHNRWSKLRWSHLAPSFPFWTGLVCSVACGQYRKLASYLPVEVLANSSSCLRGVTQGFPYTKCVSTNNQSQICLIWCLPVTHAHLQKSLGMLAPSYHMVHSPFGNDKSHSSHIPVPWCIVSTPILPAPTVSGLDILLWRTLL